MEHTDGTHVVIGRVVRAHGIRGEIVVATDAESEALADASSIWLDAREFPVTQVRDTPRGWLIALATVHSRTEAEAFIGMQVSLPRTQIAADEDVLLEELIGYEVRLAQGGSWGRVVGIDVGGQDRLVIHGEVERLLPAVRELILAIDDEARVITIDPPGDWPTTPLPEAR